MDVPAPVAGTVTQLRVAIGDRVSEGSVLMTVEPTRARTAPCAEPRQRCAEPPDAGRRP